MNGISQYLANVGHGLGRSRNKVIVSELAVGEYDNNKIKEQIMNKYFYLAQFKQNLTPQQFMIEVLTLL